MALLEYKRDGSIREVAEPYAEILVKLKVATRYETRQMEPEKPAEQVEISERTGKPKRQYRRRDMKAED